MEHLFRALPAILSEAENNESVREAVVFAAWRRIAGDLLCEHTAPLELAEKKLTVAVINNMWKRHLEELTGQMLFQLNSALGSAGVTFIEFRIDEPFVKRFCKPVTKHASSTGEPPEMNKNVTVELLLRSEDIHDESLRKAFLSAAGSCMDRKTRMQGPTS
jgi:hypothetical protein